MQKLHLTCLYCDYKWTVLILSEESTYQCPLCADKNLKQEEQPAKYNVFGYDETND